MLGGYLDGKHNDGVFNPMHLGLYSYVGNNPLLFIDPDGLAEIIFSRPSDASVLTEHSRKVISDRADRAGINSVEITSIDRGATRQRNAMHKTILAHGADATREKYREAGKKVVDAYVAAKKAEKSEEEAKAAMLDQIVLEPPSLHMNQDKSKLQVIDIAPDSIPADKVDAWKKQSANGVRVIPPGPGERAWHFEIKQPPQRESSCGTFYDDNI